MSTRESIIFARTGRSDRRITRVGCRRQQLFWILTRQLSILETMPTFALTELLGAPVFDSAGSRCGRVREVALVPQEDRARVAMLIVKTGSREPSAALCLRDLDGWRDPHRLAGGPMGFRRRLEGMLLLERDLLDQQVIDVFGRKVVRVNDLDLAAGITRETGRF